MSKHILIIEDDTRLATLTSEYLQMQGFTVTCHTRGDTAEATILDLLPDLIILDVLLPGKSGFDICRDIRPFYHNPILILTASEDNIDEIIGLELGADDYLTKPVEPRRLLARIRVLLRRQPKHYHLSPMTANGRDDSSQIPISIPINAIQPQYQSSQRLTFGDLTIDGNNRTVQIKDAILDFTTAEFDLLWLLASHAGTILTRDISLMIFEVLILMEMIALLMPKYLVCAESCKRIQIIPRGLRPFAAKAISLRSIRRYKIFNNP